MGAPVNQVTVVEEYSAAPPPNTVSELSFPLTFCDIMWIGFAPIQRLLFYELPISKSHFIDNIIPKLKFSLNLALQQFPALAGNLIIPSDSSMPEIRYANGDSVPLIFAESDYRDFDYLTGNQARYCSEFHPFVAQVPKSSKLSCGLTKVPLLAIQVTLFPEIGICIGISNQHAAGDGSSMYAFTKAWTKLSTLGKEAIISSNEEDLPYYNRDVMSHTKELDDMFWIHTRNKLKNDKPLFNIPPASDKVRSTFVVSPEDAQKLKNYVLNQRSSIKHVSTFTVVCSYVWTCLIKASNTINDKVDEEEEQYFGFVADCRGRSNPPIPTNYFGNCLVYCIASATIQELVSEEGLSMAAERAGESIHKRFRSKDKGPFDGLGELFAKLADVNMDRVLSIAGSPKQNYYEMDFGWGKPKKFEFVSIDVSGALSLSGCRDSGGVEAGLAMSKNKMDAFTAFFNEGIKAL